MSLSSPKVKVQFYTFPVHFYTSPEKGKATIPMIAHFLQKKLFQQFVVTIVNIKYSFIHHKQYLVEMMNARTIMIHKSISYKWQEKIDREKSCEKLECIFPMYSII